MINNSLEEIRDFNLKTMDLNFFETYEELSFLDECISPLVYCASLGELVIN
jgi:hypothetical protein